MNDIAQAPVLDGPGAVDSATLQGRLVARRQVIRDKQPFDIVVPGYEGILNARYRAVDYRVLRNIGLRQENNPDQADAELKVAADTLVTACDELLEVLPDGTSRPLGFKWGVDVAHQLFGVGEDELPPGSTARDALLRVLEPVDLVLHYAEYDRRSRSVEESVQRDLQGESEASSAVV